MRSPNMRRCTFRAIIADANPTDHDAVLEAADLDESEPLMEAPHSWTVRRVGTELADAMAPMLRVARRLVFVDRYFDIRAPRYRETLEACLRVASSGGRRRIQCEIHFADHDSRPPMDEMERMASRWLGGVVPAGTSVTLHAWREKPGGEDFHARDLLTDVGGINVEAGLLGRAWGRKRAFDAASVKRLGDHAASIPAGIGRL